MLERRIRCGSFVLLCFFILTGYLHAQTTPAVHTPPVRLKVFIDCEYECDTDYLRQTIEFIDYVRDRETADLHVLVTTQGTGGGGMAWTLKFIGQDFFKDRDHTLNFTTGTTASEDDRRKELARVFKVGLVSYAVETSVAPNL